MQVGCRFDYEVTAPVHSLWQVRPQDEEGQRLVKEDWDSPGPVHTYIDAYGNRCERLDLVPASASVRYDAVVEVPSRYDDIDEGAGATLVEDLPDDAFVYLLDSRFCWPDVFGQQAWDLFGNFKPGWQRVQAVCDWVHDNITYQVGASAPDTSAYDVWQTRKGVCRDYTQLGITLCRALNIPARYVGGYIPDVGVEPSPLPMDFCSWFEAWLDGRWWTFDPRNNEPRTGRVVVARGRDALDTAMVTTWGGATLRLMTVWADEANDAR